jgi:hypothetical protein
MQPADDATSPDPSTAAADTVLAAMARLYRREQPVQLMVPAAHALAVLATLQLACRQPGFRCVTRSRAVAVGRRLQAALVELEPAVAAVLEQGWRVS